MGKKRKIKKVIEREVIPNSSAKIVTDIQGNDHIIVVNETTFYAFQNLRQGPMFFTRQDKEGKEDMFEGRELKENIDEKTRRMLLKTKDYEYGWLVEIFEEDSEEIDNANSLSDSKIYDLLERYKDDTEKLKSIIVEMTSEFAVKRIKDIFIEKDSPSSLVVYCDYKLKQLEEIEAEKHKAPIDRMGKR